MANTTVLSDIVEESETGMFDDGEFEVVDECTGEDDVPETPEKVEQKEAPKTENEGKSNGNVKPAPKPPKGILKGVSGKAASTPTKQSTEKGSNGESMDFTADVSVEPDSQKDDTIDDGGDVIQIDVTDTMILDSEEGENRSEAVTDVTSNSESDKNADGAKEVEIVEEIPPEHAWYEEKLNGKMTIVKERLSKLARVLEFSYPAYKPWLEHYKDPVCHLEPPRRCPLARPHSNRWKFICSRKPVQESTNKEEDSAEGTVNKKVETVWRLGPTDGSGINTDNTSQYPPFVMRVVKVFEEFIQNVELAADSEPAETVKEEPETVDISAEKTDAPEVKIEDAPKEATEAAADAPEVQTEDTAATVEKPEADENKEEATEEKETVIDRNHNWLWLLVRSNSKDELMVFATGKKISQATMEKLKETFETGPGKDCNVKSLYCKSISKTGTTTTTNITFLAGSEALDETVGGLKIQLAPKTNFWCNASGVEQLGAAVGDLLDPADKLTVAEVGCGLGLIGLMQAPKCRKVIGLDAPSEVEEAEMTSELNKIENSAFVMGQPEEMMTQLTKLLKNTRSAAIVNANTRIGRTIEMMTALRKIPTLRRVVMITTLTKQSVRAILELTRPADGDLGNPFMPVRAVLVDTLPTGPHFEVVIRMERLTVHKISEPWFWNHVQFRAGLITQAQQQKLDPKKNDKTGKASVPATKAGVKGAGPAKVTNAAGASAQKRSNNRANKRNKLKRQAQLKAAGQGVVVGSRIVVGPGLVTGVVKNAPKNLVKNPMAGGKVGPKNTGKNQSMVRSPGRGKRPHSPDKSNAGVKKFARGNKQGTKPLQPTKLSPDSPNPQQANRVSKPNKPKIQSPLKKNPLARVPSRGAPNSGGQKRRRNWGAEVSMMRGQPMPPKRMRDQNQGDDLRVRLSEGRMDPALYQQVQEQQMLLSLAQQKLATQGPVVDVQTAKELQNMLNIVLEQTNKQYNQMPRSNVWDRIAPLGNSGYNSPPQNVDNNRDTGFRDRFVQGMGSQDMQITAQNREFGQPNQQGPMPLFPSNRLPLSSHEVAPAGMSPLEYSRGRGMPDRSQGGRDNWQRQNQSNRGSQQSANKIPSLSSQVDSMRGSSPKRPLLSPPRVDVPSSRRFNAPTFPQPSGDMRRPQSPPRRQMSPPRRQMSPPRNQNSEIFHRRPSASQGGRQQSSNSQRRGISPPRQRDQMPTARSNSPFKKFGDEWDIPNRSTLEQTNWRQGQQNQQQQRSIDRNTQEKRWSNDRPTNSQNWDISGQNDRFQKMDQGKWMGGSGGGGGDAWNSKQSSMKAGNKEQWSQGPMNKQWGGGGGSGMSGDNWNIRGKDNYGQSNNSRMDYSKKGNKEDWSDLPEDARDPWGDDGGASNNKQRWQGGDGGSSSNWGNNDKMDQNWSNKPSGNWQNKGPSMGGNNMGNQNMNDQRWTPQDSQKKSQGNWQGNSNNAMNNWRPQNYSQGFGSQQQRQSLYGSNNYKGGR